MPANAAKYLLSVSDVDSRNFEVTSFSGVDAVSVPYSFDIEFRMSDAAKAANIAPLDAGVLNKACRLDIVRNGETIPYSGIVSEFRVCDSDDARYAVRLVPRMYRLTLNFSSCIFQGYKVPDIIDEIVKKADLSEYFRLDELKSSKNPYPVRKFCVQYQETDLAFISRLMEESGIWYYFEQVKRPDGTLIERAVVTDAFSSYPILGRPIPFMNGSGLAEVTETGGMVESINYISARAALMPKNVRVRAYNHRVPETPPDGMEDVVDGHFGQVYEYGGSLQDSSEAQSRAALHIRRLWVERHRVEGKGNCASFRAGLRVPINHSGNPSMSGGYLLVSVKHIGGWEGGAYTYRNEFSSVRAEPETYAPPLRTPVPRIDGVTTARVGATGDNLPTLDGDGNYNVNMPFVLDNDQGGSDRNGGDYGKSKPIRLAQPSGGMSGDAPYGVHIAAKRGAEMVLAYVDGNPDKPIGLGFVPNAASRSVVRSENCVENVIRSWGGNELVMTDADGDKKVKVSTPEKRLLELYDGKKQVRLKSEYCEMLFNDEENFAQIDAGGHRIHINYKKDEGNVSITTVKKHLININDEDDEITVKTAKGCVMHMSDNSGSILLSNAAHDGGGELRLESCGDICIKAAGGVFVTGAQVQIASVEKDVDIESKNNVQVKSEKSINMKSQKQITQDADESVSLKSPKVNVQGDSKIDLEGGDVTIIGSKTVGVDGKQGVEIESSGNTSISGVKTALKGKMITIN